MLEGTKIAKDFYSSELRGGESHMEVANTIKNFFDRPERQALRLHAELGDQRRRAVGRCRAVPGTIFCAVETTVNFYSRE